MRDRLHTVALSQHLLLLLCPFHFNECVQVWVTTVSIRAHSSKWLPSMYRIDFIIIYDSQATVTTLKVDKGIPCHNRQEC